MMRSMYSAVSGLKTHQTKMDVIGNNIANVNTVAFKSSSVTFSEIMYQTISSASSANPTTGIGGVNAKQIGLGVTSGATAVSITSAGAAQTTGNAFDIKITDSGNTTSFFVVSNGTENLFTRAGSFYIDGSGNLAMTSTGYNVMGWQVDETTGEIRKDSVSALRIMQEKNLTSSAEATTAATCAGVVDKNSADITSADGYAMNLNFYDSLGYSYTAKFAIKAVDTETGKYTVELSAIYDSDNQNILETYLADGKSLTNLFGAEDGAQNTYSVLNSEWIAGSSTVQVNGGDYPGTFQSFTNTGDGKTYYINTAGVDQVPTNPDSRVYCENEAGAIVPVDDVLISDIYSGLQTGANIVAISSDNPPTITASNVNYTLQFDADNGAFESIGNSTNGIVSLNLKQLGGNFENIAIDFTQCLNSNNGGTSTVGMDAGAVDGTTGTGKKLGSLTGVSVDSNGKIYGSYDNGNTVLLGQIAAARFSNAAGLEKVGDNCYRTTLNSGEFDGIGVEIDANGSTMSTGELEMSNVDLASEFTEMITTQRGFQANSRVITTSDTLLEELINLKR
ncbi:MAG: flagellar hook protein FlgE [Roseburia sp.]